MVSELLAEEGYVVLEAEDGAQALEVAERHEGPIHLLVSDVTMPRMGGRELAERQGRTPRLAAYGLRFAT